MKKILGVIIVLISFAITTTAVIATCIDAYKWIQKYENGAGLDWWNIPSVQWVASIKSCGTTDNTCALWFGSDNSKSDTIEIDENLVYESGGRRMYNIRLWGMCTANGSNNAQSIAICSCEDAPKCDKCTAPDGYAGIFENLPGTVSRGGWGNPMSTVGVRLDIEKFKEQARKENMVVELGNGEFEYTLMVPLKRCHMGCGPKKDNCCSSQETQIKLKEKEDYLSRSGVAVGGVYDMTQIVREGQASVTVSVKKGETREIRFSHNAYAVSKTEKEVEWKVFAESWSDVAPKKNQSGKTTFTVLEDKYYVPENRVDDGSGNKFLYRYVFNVKFDNVGTYEFCERINVNNKNMTGACAKITVTDEDNPPNPESLCDVWVNEINPNYIAMNGRLNGSVMEGWTYVEAKIKNERFGGWKDAPDSDPIYAMPTDKITWMNCYYPGVQAMKDESVVIPGEHADDDTHCNTTLATETLQEYVGEWKNEFSVTSENDNVKKESLKDPKTVVTMNDVSFDPSPDYVSYWSKWKLGAKITLGKSETKYTKNTYQIYINDDTGYFYKETIDSPAYPQYVRIDYATHQWKWNYCCCSSYSCGEYGNECCPKKCWCCSHNNNFYGFNYNSPSSESSELSDSNKVIVPYNFENSASLDVVSNNKDGYDVAYAGETIAVQNVKVSVKPRKNDATNATYATQVDGAQVEMIAYVTTNPNDGSRVEYGSINDKICSHFATKQCASVKQIRNTVLNRPGKDGEHGNLEKGYDYYNSVNGATFNGTYNVFDANAGDYMCFAIGVYPASSVGGNGDKTTDSEGDHKWYISESKCKIIAKKPSLQVWGNGVFSNGAMNTNVSVKQQLFGIFNYEVQDRSNATINGSWVEQGIVSNGDVKEFSSGASLGLNDDGRITGVKEKKMNSFCEQRVPLSIANYSNNSGIGEIMCPNNGVVGNANIAVMSGYERKALADYWGSGTNDYSNSGHPIDLAWVGDKVVSATDKDIKIIEANDSLTIGNSYINKDTLRVVKAGKDVIISGDIKYAADDNLYSAGQIPKVIIYAAHNIYIECGVVQVDAILIAEDGVSTCYNGDNLSAKQLKINGTVIANYLEPIRAYGNAMGKYSGTPAEIINYDSSVLSWGRYMAGSGESDTMTVIYVHELAPRY